MPDKENAKRFTGTKKSAGTKTHKGACADWVFVEAEPPKGGEAVTVCYVPYFALYNIFRNVIII